MWDGETNTVEELAGAVEVLCVLMAGTLAVEENGSAMLVLFDVKVVCVAGAETKEELPVASVEVLGGLDDSVELGAAILPEM